MIDPHGQYPRTSTHKHPPRPPTAGPTFNAQPPPALNVQPDPTTLLHGDHIILHASIPGLLPPPPTTSASPPTQLITITLLLRLMKCTSNISYHTPSAYNTYIDKHHPHRNPFIHSSPPDHPCRSPPPPPVLHLHSMTMTPHHILFTPLAFFVSPSSDAPAGVADSYNMSIFENAYTIPPSSVPSMPVARSPLDTQAHRLTLTLTLTRGMHLARSKKPDQVLLFSLRMIPLHPYPCPDPYFHSTLTYSVCLRLSEEYACALDHAS